VQKIKAAGGSLIYGPIDIPIARMAVVLDPQGQTSRCSSRATPSRASRTRSSALGRAASRAARGLGAIRWVVERPFAWRHSFRLLRWDRLAEVHAAFLKLGCALICGRLLGAQ
jgi:hypothetical protein